MIMLICFISLLTDIPKIIDETNSGSRVKCVFVFLILSENHNWMTHSVCIGNFLMTNKSIIIKSML